MVPMANPARTRPRTHHLATLSSFCTVEIDERVQLLATTKLRQARASDSDEAVAAAALNGRDCLGDHWCFDCAA